MIRSLAGALLVAAVIAAAVIISGPAADPPSSATPLTGAELKALPAHLAANASESSKVIDGSIASELAKLRGIPVVVNQWASWCPNCRQEFPLFRQLSNQLHGEVAFLGLDSGDRRGSAESFLDDFPVPYPSVFDPEASQARSLGGGRGWPTTFFYDRLGRRTYVREGGYLTASTLRSDIESYALAGG